MKRTFKLLAGGFSYIGRSTSARFEPLSATPFADAKRSLVRQSVPVISALKQKVEKNKDTDNHTRKSYG